MFENKKILLINPPYYRFYNDRYSLNRLPFSISYLAGAILNNNKWEVKTFNADFHPEAKIFSNSFITGPGYKNYQNSINNLEHPLYKKTKSIISSFSPSIVGITSMTQNFISALNVAKIAKEVDINTLVILGGPHVSLVKEECLCNEYVDLCVIGEGEETIVDLINCLENGDDISKIPGIISKDDKTIHFSQTRSLIDNLDKLEFPFISAKKTLIDFEKYPPYAFQYIFSSRGCPFNCIFCASKYTWGRKMRFRSSQNVLDEIAVLVDNRITSFHFDDDSFGVDSDYLDDLCSKIAKYFPMVEWSCEMHVKCVKDEQISKMKMAGCRTIIVGFESGNDEMLKKIGKHNTVRECLRAAEIIKRNKILLNGFFMVGFPWETEETLHDTLKFIRKLNCNMSGYSIFTPYKGTEAFEVCKQMGLIADDYNPSLYNHQSPNNCFCKIPRERFREICSLIERNVDNLNYINRIKSLFRSNIFAKITNTGLKNSLKKGLTIFCQK